MAEAYTITDKNGNIIKKGLSFLEALNMLSGLLDAKPEGEYTVKREDIPE